MEDPWENLRLLADVACYVSENEKAVEKNKKRKKVDDDDEFPSCLCCHGETLTQLQNEQEEQQSLVPGTIPTKKRNTIRKKRTSMATLRAWFSRPEDSDEEERTDSDEEERTDSDEDEEERRVLEAPRPAENLAVDLPANLMERIAEMGGRDVVLVLEKNLFPTDVATNNNRLSMPLSILRVAPEEFLTDSEVERLPSKDGVTVTTLDERLRVYSLKLKLWTVGNGSQVYNLISQWNSFVFNNDLKRNDVVRVWAFRSGPDLCFAIAKVDDDVAPP